MGSSASAGVKRQIELDFIRGIAILLVLDFHFRDSSPFNILLRRIGFEHPGWAGVDLFFTLSGFLVGGLLLKEWKRNGRIDGFRFLKRRAFKIWPAYYVLILFEVVSRFNPWRTFLVGNLLNIQNYTGSHLYHTWSLAVEEHFYLLLTAFLVWCASRKREMKWVAWTLVITGTAVAVLRTTLLYLQYRSGLGADLNADSTGVPYYTHTRIDGLLWGVLLAVLFHYYPLRFEWLRARRIALAAIVVAAVGGLYFVAAPAVHAGSVIIADVGCLAVFLLLYRPANRHSWPYRLVAWIGVYSYGIYLWHLVAMDVVLRVVNRIGMHFHRSVPDAGVYAMLFMLSVVLGIGMTKIIEFPFLRLRERVVPSAAEPEPDYVAAADLIAR